MAERYRYFLFSISQLKMRTEAEKTLGKQYIPGKVLVKGVWKDYTEISTSSFNNKFADSKVVAEVDIDTMTYRKNTSTWLRGFNR